MLALYSIQVKEESSTKGCLGDLSSSAVTLSPFFSFSHTLPLIRMKKHRQHTMSMACRNQSPQVIQNGTIYTSYIKIPSDSFFLLISPFYPTKSFSSMEEVLLLLIAAQSKKIGRWQDWIAQYQYQRHLAVQTWDFYL